MDERLNKAIVEWEAMLSNALDERDRDRLWGRMHCLWSEVKAVKNGDWDRYEMLREERPAPAHLLLGRRTSLD